MLQASCKFSIRKIIFSYGDASVPSYTYKNEEAILTKVTSNVDFMNSKIEYTLTATSNALSMTSIPHNFSARRAKPSDVIKELLRDTRYDLVNIFYGMRGLDASKLNRLIDGTDKVVQLKAQQNISILNYINYLVSCMTAINDTSIDNLNKILQEIIVFLL